MIRVVKPDEPPAILIHEGRARRTQHEIDFALNRAAFEAGECHFDFDRKLYAGDAVRTVLSQAQHGKCCFCESKIQHVSDGDVEHFRPKAAVRQTRSTPMELPGYYWLVYEWSNLYFACQLCNQRNKQSLFPLQNPEARVRSHEDADRVAEERPSFIDPGLDDPERLLGYRDGEPYAINGNPRADATKRELELGRDHLMERRWELVRMIEVLLCMLEAARTGTCEDADVITRSAALLGARTRDTAEFTSMTRHLVRDKLGASIRMPLTTEELLAFARGEPLPVGSAPSGA